MKVVLAHDWLFHMRGGEKVLENVSKIFPEAPIYTLFCEKENLSSWLRSRTIYPSIFNTPFFRKYYQQLLPFLPFMVKSIHIPKDCDVLITFSSCVIHGIKKPSQTKHVNWVFSPMRYMDPEMFDYYFPKGLKRFVAKIIRPFLDAWDRKAASTITGNLATSHFIAERVVRRWGTSAVGFWAPVELHRFEVQEKKKDFYLIVSALNPYKNVELAVEAFNLMPDKKLIVVGKGSEEQHLREIAKSNVQILGFQPDDQVTKLYQDAKALIYPQVEDFGITVLEALACGTPVIAYGKGGALETVTKETGLFFHEQTSAGLQRAVLDFEGKVFDPWICRKRAELFSEEEFRKYFASFVKEKLT